MIESYLPRFRTPLSRTLVGSLLFALALSGCAPAPESAESPPSENEASVDDGARPMNCLIIVLDAFHAAKSSLYGYPKQTTPHIDTWAQNGIVFEDALSQFTSTSPSAWSYLNGTYPYRAGRFFPNRPGDIPLATLFQNAGYRCGGFSDNPFINGSLKMDRGFTHFEYYKYDDSNMLLKNAALSSPDPENFERTRNEISELLFTQLERWVTNGDAEPWFGYVHTLRPHNPYAPEEPWLSAFFDTSELPSGVDAQEHLIAMEKTFFEANFLQPEVKNPEQLALLHDLYLSNIAYADHLVGTLLQSLRRANQLDNTFVVIMSDHGEAFGEHNNSNHGGAPYRELNHVPLILIPPAHMDLTPGRIGKPVELIDLLPTLDELFRLEDTKERDGQSLLPLLRREPGYEKERRYSQSRWRLAVQDDTHKYILSLHNTGPPKVRPPELFNVRNDPKELDNLIDTGEAVGPLMKFAMEYVRRQRTAVPPKPPELTKEEIETLESLGYVE